MVMENNISGHAFQTDRKFRQGCKELINEPLLGETVITKSCFDGTISTEGGQIIKDAESKIGEKGGRM